MRLLLIFSFSFLIATASGQNITDSLNTLEIKAKEYLIQAYANQNFDSAVKTWHSFVFSEVKEMYKKRGVNLLNQAELINQLKQDYHSFYATNKDFIFISFLDKGMSDESKIPAAYFKYSYQEKVNGKLYSGSSYLYFLFDTEGSVWKILDFRVSALLGDENRWLK
jgi:hypothetical protein